MILKITKILNNTKDAKHSDGENDKLNSKVKSILKKNKFLLIT